VKYRLREASTGAEHAAFHYSLLPSRGCVPKSCSERSASDAGAEARQLGGVRAGAGVALLLTAIGDTVVVEVVCWTMVETEVSISVLTDVTTEVELL